MKESEIQKEILVFLRYKGIMAWRNQNVAVYDATKKVFRNNSTQKGISDIIGILPNGRMLAIEVKKPGGRVSPEQAQFIRSINASGGLGFIAYDVTEVQSAILSMEELWAR